MNCPEALTLTHPYSDGELDLVRSLDLEKHLAQCPSCSRAYEDLNGLKSALHSTDLYFKAPASLRRQVRASIAAESAKADRAPFSWWTILKLGVPAMGAALVLLLMFPVLNQHSLDDRLAQEVTSAHVRSLMVNHKIDVISADPHTVKPWFQGKLDFTLPVVDLADRGFPLIGGRLDYLQGRPVAALIYQRHQHFINLFVWPAVAAQDKPQTVVVRQGYNLIHWTASGMTFWAISDLNRTELSDFARLIK